MNQFDVTAADLAELVATTPDLTARQVDTVIDILISLGALFVVNHSGGKDSQALRAVVEARVPREQILVVHADLPEVEWAHTWEHVQYDCQGLETVKTSARKSLIDMALWRGRWPTPAIRQCTSDLKRGPLEKVIRHWLAGCACTRTHSTTECKTRHGKKVVLRCGGVVVNTMGLRAGESSARSKLRPLKLNKGASKGGRIWFDWLPIHDYACVTDRRFDPAQGDAVTSVILASGKRLHAAYGYDPRTGTYTGMQRLSCMFCIMASREDLAISARANPGPYALHVATERLIGHTLAPSARRDGSRPTLEEHTGVPADPRRVEFELHRLTERRRTITASGPGEKS